MKYCAASGPGSPTASRVPELPRGSLARLPSGLVGAIRAVVKQAVQQVTMVASSQMLSVPDRFLKFFRKGIDGEVALVLD